MNHCTFCHSDAAASNFYVTVAEDVPQYQIWSACYLVAIRHGFTVVFREAAVA